MALEQLRGGDPGTASSREELSVLRGIAEELGLLGGAEAVRKFTAAFGVKQVRGVRPDILSCVGVLECDFGVVAVKVVKRVGNGFYAL